MLIRARAVCTAATGFADVTAMPNAGVISTTEVLAASVNFSLLYAVHEELRYLWHAGAA